MRSINLEMHMRTCTGAAVAAVSSTPAYRRGAASSTPAHRGGAAFAVRRRRRALGGATEMHTVDMQEANQLAALQEAVLAFEHVMEAYRRVHSAYKFQVAVDVMFHNAVDPAVVTKSPVILRCEMAAVYADGSHQLEEAARDLLVLVEVCEHYGSRWVFSNIASLQLTLWHLDPLPASAFVPLPKWIRDKRAVTNIIGTGDDCFKWAILAGLHPTTSDRPNRIDNYMVHANKYDFSSLTFPVPLSSIASFGTKNNISINVYGVEDGKKVIYPLRVSDAVVPGRHVDLLLHELGEIQHYSTIKDSCRNS